jgi:hypothetical protein
VSKGQSVLFEDFLPGGGSANGQYRRLENVTKDSSNVTTFFSVPQYSIGTQIKVKSTVLNSLGQKTTVADSIILTVNQ